MSAEWVPFRYREFYDYPRAIVVEHLGGRFMLDCPFDYSIDEYPEEYQVVALDGDESLQGSWANIRCNGAVLGTVKVSPALFDQSRRRLLRWDLVLHSLGLEDGR